MRKRTAELTAQECADAIEDFKEEVLENNITGMVIIAANDSHTLIGTVGVDNDEAIALMYSAIHSDLGGEDDEPEEVLH